MAVKQETLYIKGDKNIEVTKPEVTLGDILSMECSNQNVIPRLKTIKVMKMQEKNGQRKVISILKIIKLIHEIYPNMDVQNLGETDIIVTYEAKNNRDDKPSDQNRVYRSIDIYRCGICNHDI